MKEHLKKDQNVILISNSYEDKQFFNIDKDPIPGEMGLIVKNFEDGFYEICIRNNIITVKEDMIIPYEKQDLRIDLHLSYRTIVEVLIDSRTAKLEIKKIKTSSQNIINDIKKEILNFTNSKDNTFVKLINVYAMLYIKNKLISVIHLSKDKVLI